MCFTPPTELRARELLLLLGEWLINTYNLAFRVVLRIEVYTELVRKERRVLWILVSDTLARDGGCCVHRRQVAWKTRVLPRCEQDLWYCNTRRLGGQTHTHIYRRVCRSPDDGCSPRDAQDSYEALTIRKFPHERVRYSKDTAENSRGVVPPHITCVVSQPTHVYEIHHIYVIQERCYWTLTLTGYELTFQ